MNRRPFTMMSRAAAVLAATSMTVSPLLAQANSVGINAAIRNKVQIRSGRQARPAVLRARVLLNDEVMTGAASQLQILLLDRTIFTVGANARVAVDRFVYDPARNSRSTGISVTKGAFRFMSGRSLGRPSGPVTVRTPVATIGIRGTIFEGVVGEDAVRIASREPAVGKKVKVNKDEASLIVLRGPGPRTQGDVRPGAIDVISGAQTVTLDGPGLAAFAPRNGAPLIGPFPISAAGLQALQALLRTTAEPGGGDKKKSHTTRNILIGLGAAAAVAGGVAATRGKKRRPDGQQPNGLPQKPKKPKSPNNPGSN